MHFSLSGLGQGDCATNTTPGMICGYDSNNVPEFTSGTTSEQMNNPQLSSGAIAQALAISTSLPSGESFNAYTGNVVQSGDAPTPIVTPIATSGGQPMGPVPVKPASLVPGLSNSSLFLAAGLIAAAVVFSKR